MNNEPAKEPIKGHFFDLFNQGAQPQSGPRSIANVKKPVYPMPGGRSGMPMRAHTAGGASGRHGGKSR